MLMINSSRKDNDFCYVGYDHNRDGDNVSDSGNNNEHENGHVHSDNE